MDFVVGKILSFSFGLIIVMYALSIANVFSFSFSVRPFPYLADSTLIVPLLRSSQLNFILSISIGLNPQSLKMLKIRLCFVPELEIKNVVSSVVGTYGGWLVLLILGNFHSMLLYFVYLR